MRQYIVSQKAQNDLTGIWAYTFNTWSPEQADSYYSGLLQTFQEIADSPLEKGRPYDVVRSGLFRARYRHHVIFFRLRPNHQIRIVRILHERMDFPRHL